MAVDSACASGRRRSGAAGGDSTSAEPTDRIGRVAARGWEIHMRWLSALLALALNRFDNDHHGTLDAGWAPSTPSPELWTSPDPEASAKGPATMMPLTILRHWLGFRSATCRNRRWPLVQYPAVGHCCRSCSS